MKLKILLSGLEDLADGRAFCAKQGESLGDLVIGNDAGLRYLQGF